MYLCSLGSGSESDGGGMWVSEACLPVLSAAVFTLDDGRGLGMFALQIKERLDREILGQALNSHCR
jgi:hypothetical protein